MARYKKGTTPKLTKELIEEICLVISNGGYIESAAALAGISKDTFYRYLREAKKENASDLHLELSYAVKLALAEDEIFHLKNIDKAAKGVAESYVLNSEGEPVLDEFDEPIVKKYILRPNWRASAWRLSRRFPARWGTSRCKCSDNNPLEDKSNLEANENIDIVVYVDAPAN